MEKGLGEILRNVLNGKDRTAEERMYDLCYVITMLDSHKYFDLKRYYELFEDLFDRALRREKVTKSELKNPDLYIKNMVTVLSDLCVKRCLSIEQFIGWINEIPADEQVYENIGEFY